jgi:hypothetical protein
MDLFYSKGKDCSSSFFEDFFRKRKRTLEKTMDARKIIKVDHHGAFVLVAKKYATTRIPMPYTARKAE